VLHDPATGRPRCVLDGNAITSARTAAAGAITVFDLTGLALQDLAVARMVLTQAETQGLGLDIAWPW
jgi:ornithine cyclodeaminase/alanine dehydrogenase-like protein (mu-crystallin family)